MVLESVYSVTWVEVYGNMVYVKEKQNLENARHCGASLGLGAM